MQLRDGQEFPILCHEVGAGIGIVHFGRIKTLASTEPIVLLAILET